MLFQINAKNLPIKNGNLITWPGINISTFFHFLLYAISKTLGHLYQEINNIQPNTTETTIDIEEIQDSTPSQI